MAKPVPFHITREKHLDHMVRVVPFIVMGFAIHSYILSQISAALGTSSVIFLGLCLVMMIGAFITYDVKHQVTFHADHLEIRFLFLQKNISYHEIVSTHVSESKQTFASVTLRTQKQKFTFYFVDDADRVKDFLDKKHLEEFQEAA